MFFQTLNYIIPLLFLYMSSFFIVSQKMHNLTVVDLAWGLGFVLINWTCLFINQSYNPRSLIIVALVTCWGLRLFSHLYTRVMHKPEDKRYTQLKSNWQNNLALKIFFYVFMLQGVLLLCIAVSCIWVHATPQPPFAPLDYCALGCWCIGFFFEVVGDWQLAQFVRNPSNKGKIMQTGLWAYTRHPNYFGEIVMWWSIWLFTLQSNGGLVTILSPVTITILLLFVSGIPMTEKEWVGNAAFEQYKKRTSALIPWFKG